MLASTRLPAILLAFAAITLPACLHKNVYTYPKGNIPVVVTNHYNYAVCAFNMRLPGEAHTMGWDPLNLKNPPDQIGGDESPPSNPVTPLPPGQTIQVSVRAGTYRFEAKACDSDLSGNLDLVIDRPLAVTLGQTPAPAPSGSASVAVKFGRPAYRDMSCIPDGEWRDYQGPVCCTNTKHYSSQLGRYVCGR